MSETVRNEVGRTIYHSYFQFKDIVYEALNDFTNKPYPLSDLMPIIRNKIQQKYSYKNQNLQRLFQIFSYFFGKIIFKQLSNKKKAKHKIEAILFIIERELWTFYQIIDRWPLLSEINCPQSSWTLDFTQDGLKFFHNTSCTQSNCPDREKKLEQLFYENRDFIKKFLTRNSPSKDKKLVKIFQKLKNHFILKQGDLNFSQKYCWNMGDFIISLNIKEKTMIFTKNISHYEDLLNFKGLKNNILPYN